MLNELQQLHERDVGEPVHKNAMGNDEIKCTLRYLMFLKEKRDGSIKGRGCADGRPQREYITKEDSTSPTIAAEDLMLSSIIDAHERRDVATCDIPGAFMQSKMEGKKVHVKLEGIMVDVMLKIDQSKYEKYVVHEYGITVGLR